MANSAILTAVRAVWSGQLGASRKMLDLSCGDGETARLLANLGYSVVATDYCAPPLLPPGIDRVAGVDLNRYLPFRADAFDAVDLVEVIEHIENQPQLIREIARVLRPGGALLISTPNILNVFSRLRFLFTGFLRGRVRPAHYTSKPGRAPNIYLVHFYELYYLLFHYGFQIEELRRTRVKIASRISALLIWPLMWICSLIAVIRAEKDPLQRRYNWQILSFFFDPALLLSDNIVVVARKTRAVGENRTRS
ncbi:MAG TPA: methyltransferase domain-containing protein [Candidatus Binatia bacterium]